MKNQVNPATAILLCVLAGAALLLTAGGLRAAENTRSIKLAWDPNTEADLEGYMIYYKCCISGPPYEGTEAYEGQSPVIVYLEDLKNPKNPKFALSGLSKQNDYYFSVTAFDSESNESAFSNETSTWTAPTDNGSSDSSSSSSVGGDSSSDSSSPNSGGGGSSSGSSSSSGGGGCFIQSAALFGCAR